MPPDADLVREAQLGDVSALGLLLARHRAGMYGVALSLLGAGPDAEDAVQEASLVAVRRIGDLRDPAAAGPWLRAVVRNASRAQLRREAARPVRDDVLQGLLPVEPDLAEVLERQALRDWVWHALDGLTPPLRLVTVLRHFTGLTRYEAIAEVCAIPVGTVRSRLSQARAKLAEALLATADAAHADTRLRTAARRSEAEEVFRAAEAGSFGEALAALYAPAVESFWPGGARHRGRRHLVDVMESDLAVGVRQRLTGVVAGPDVLVWECDLVNPPEDPEHCPPGVVWVQSLARGRVHELRLYHHPR
ncbi:RNA polymerase sigma factor [Nucisporomicrobium flavum]|uniref:RNA polymerase sigma factor n=1 Tax=Nucisporomicrobium flavum TaxID=2785915 RepID=UPI0018F5C1D6|nr:sigma-70 family RNA polymerase sigma factor [Nucisporomicrobium flavum]